PDNYVHYRERRDRAATAAASTEAARLNKDRERALRELLLKKFNDLGDEERDSLMTEASEALGPFLGASKGLSVALALELLREREEST
ncbi:MAG TPA: hypothetical protein VN328_01270, partial [Thermodesulfovibrionales bacterium]|nr:hypothetical protein [Thermodesulfovibrionales bacterium]